MGSSEAGAPLHISSHTTYPSSSPFSANGNASRASIASSEPAIHPNGGQTISGQPDANHPSGAPGPLRGARQGLQAPEHRGPDWLQESAVQLATVRYRGFVLIPQGDLTWLIRPERSPMRVLPFRAPASSLSDVKALIDWRLNQLTAG